MAQPPIRQFRISPAPLRTGLIALPTPTPAAATSDAALQDAQTVAPQSSLSPIWSRWITDLVNTINRIAGTTYGSQSDRLLPVNSASNYPDGALWIETDTGNTIYQNRMVNGAQTWVPLSTIAFGAFSTNWDWDSGTGASDSVTGDWNFVSVPAGKAVQLLRIYGNWIAWASGTVPAGDNAGVGFKIYNTASAPDPDVSSGDAGVYLSLEGGLASDPVTLPFDFDVSNAGPLAVDNIMRQQFRTVANTTGLSVHIEAQMVVEFMYV